MIESFHAASTEIAKKMIECIQQRTLRDSLFYKHKMLLADFDLDADSIVHAVRNPFGALLNHLAPLHQNQSIKGALGCCQNIEGVLDDIHHASHAFTQGYRLSDPSASTSVIECHHLVKTAFTSLQQGNRVPDEDSQNVITGLDKNLLVIDEVTALFAPLKTLAAKLQAPQA